MTPDNPNWLTEPTPGEALIQSLFLEGAERDAEGRAAVLARATDDAARARLSELFAAHDALGPERERTPSVPPDPQRWIGARFGEFTVQTLLASGSSADVYLAQQRSPAREVVLKIRRARHGSPGQLRRFLAEAQNLARFSHPGVAHIYGSGIDDRNGEPVAWIAMERIDGTPLPEWRERVKPSASVRCALVADVARIVAAAHAQGIIHRDLAPRNITVEPDGRPRVLDYGISRTLHTLDEHPTIEGTPGFASPEQRSGLPADPRDDVYALGRLLQWLAPDAPPSASAAGEAAAAAVRASRPDAARFAADLAEAVAPRRRAHAAAVVAVILLIGLIGSWVAATPSKSEGMSAQTVERLLAAVLETSSAERGGTPKSGVKEKIARAEDAILDETRAPPGVRWRALEKISTVWRDLGEAGRAVNASRAAARIAESDPGAPPLIAQRLRAWCAVRLAFAGERQACLDAVEASLAELATSAVASQDGAVAPSEDTAREAHQNYAQALAYLALAAKLSGDLERARHATGLARPFHRTGVFAGTISQVTYLINAARLEMSLGDMDGAVALAEEAVAASAIAEKDDPEGRLETLALQAGILERAGRFGDAAEIYRRSFDTWTAIGGANDRRTITALNNLGLNTLRRGDAAGAIPLLEDAAARALRVHGERHQHTLDNHYNLALALDGAGRLADAEALVDRLLPIVSAARGSPSLDECDWLLLRGRLLAKQGRGEEALISLERARSAASTLVGGEEVAKNAAIEIARLSSSKVDR